MVAFVNSTCLHYLSAAWYGSHQNPESSKSWTLWCSVDSWSCAELSFGPWQSVDGDHQWGYHRHQDPYSVTMGVVLWFALAGQLMQMPATAHSIPTICEVSMYDLQRISNDYSFRQKHPCVPDGSDGSDGTSYPLMENFTLPVAQATGPSSLDWCSGLQVHLGAPGSTVNHCRAVWEKHLLWECCWCAWKS